MMDRRTAVDFLLTKPYKFGHLLGFAKLTELHNEWIVDMVRGKEDASLMAHRASFKTTCVSIALALIVILLPNERILFMRKTDNDVKEVIKQVKNILSNPKTQYFVQCIYGVPLKLNVASATEISTNLTTDIKGTSQIVGIGTQASLTGKHFDRIFTDDIININDRISRAERERTKVVYQELQNIKNRGGRIYNTLTPWHKDDASTLMPKPKRYDCYTTGLIADDELAAIKESMTSSLFAANYELRHIAEEDIIFDTPTIGADKALAEQGICHLDAAFYGEDYTAFTVVNFHDGKYYVFGKCWRKHVEDCYNEIMKYYEEFMCGKCYIETNADKGMVARDLRNNGMRTVTYAEHMNKFLKIVTYLKAIWKDIIFVEGTDNEYIDQVCEFSENADHDDCPDSLASLARIFYKKNTRANADYKPMFL